jgi:hypothetical protein
MKKLSLLALGSLTVSLLTSALSMSSCANSGNGGTSSGVIDSGIAQSEDSAIADASPDTAFTQEDTGSLTMGTVPTTCAAANGSLGCCANGENYYCGGDGGTVSSKSCSGETTEAGTALVCGWNSTKGYYGCVEPPAGSDPAGVPLACGSGPFDSGTATDTGAPTDSGTATDSGYTTTDSGVVGDSGSVTDSGGAGDGAVGGGTPTTCAQAYGVVGCCGANGDNYYCKADAGTVTMTACATGKVCGWNATDMYYGCVAPPATTDPSGTNPIACQ